jgi:hypothetical protein
MIEVVQNPLSHVFAMLLFAVGLTAIMFIALILYLDIRHREEPVALPDDQ